MIKLRTNIVCLFLFLPMMVMGQNEIEVPQEVKVQFTEDFISSASTAWMKDEIGNYKADFVHQSQIKTAAYTKDGVWQFTETRLFPGQVPSHVLQSLSNGYKAYDIQQIRKIETRLDISFKFRIRVKNSIYEIEIDPSGKIKSKRKVSDVKDVEEKEEHKKEKEKEKEEKYKKKEKHKENKNEKD